jgi:hypothetical protein
MRTGRLVPVVSDRNDEIGSDSVLLIEILRRAAASRRRFLSGDSFDTVGEHN